MKPNVPPSFAAWSRMGSGTCGVSSPVGQRVTFLALRVGGRGRAPEEAADQRGRYPVLALAGVVASVADDEAPAAAAAMGSPTSP